MSARTARTPETDEAVDEALSIPSAALISDMASIPGDLVILGAGGKMGPTLAMLARRAFDAAGKATDDVIAVSRWSNAITAKRVAASGVSVVRQDVSLGSPIDSLPAAGNVVFMIGAKFGSGKDPSSAWMTNTVLPALVARHYAHSRLVVLSTGNVYPPTTVRTLGCREDTPVAPIGEYAMSCLGRERVVENVMGSSELRATMIRLNYAVELRYGVICDIAQRILSGDPVPLDVGYVNVVWQRYANEVILRSLLLAQNPATVINVSGPEIVSVRACAEALGRLLGRTPRFTGTEGETALLTNATTCHGLFGYPDHSVGELVQMEADWMLAGGRTLGKPTKFERADGRF